MQPKPSDPVIDEIRVIRQAISERTENNPARLVDYYIAMQERYRERLLQSEPSCDVVARP